MCQNPDIQQARDRFEAYVKIPRDATFPALPRPENFGVYAHVYWMAAEKLFESYWRGSEAAPTPDYLVMPVLYLLHHYIELELKEVVRLSNLVGQYESKDLRALPQAGTHSLTKLLNDAEYNLGELCPSEKPLLNPEYSRLITDLEEFGDKGEALRYPEKTAKQGGGPTLSDFYVADVPAAMDILRQVRERFNGAVGWLYVAQEHLQSSRNDYL